MGFKRAADNKIDPVTEKVKEKKRRTLKGLGSLRISHKMFLGFAILIALFLVLGGVSYIALTKVQGRALLVRDHAFIETISSIRAVNLADHARGDIFASAEAATTDYLDRALGLRAEIKKELEKLRTLTDGTSEADSRIKAFEQALQGVFDSGQRMVGFAVSQDLLEMISAQKEYKEAVVELKETSDTLRQGGIDRLNSALGDIDKMARRTRGLVALLMAFGFFIGSLICLFICRSIMRSIGLFDSMLRSVAEGHGDLTKRIDTGTSDEMGDLAKWFNMFIERLQEIIQQVVSVSETLATSSDQLASTTDHIATGIIDQSDRVERSASSMTEVSQTIEEVAQNAGNASSAAGESVSTASEGKRIVEETASGMGELMETVSLSSSTIEELGKSSEQIGEIVNVINDIADQTNLLALNAAIEAARAGDQGRGFAVVADEVRKLAERTSHATTEITAMISKIQEKTGDSVTNMRIGLTKTEAGIESVDKARDALGNIVSASEKSLDMIQMIASATEEQSQTIDDITTSISEIATISRDADKAVTQIRGASEELSRMAGKLKGLVHEFTV